MQIEFISATEYPKKAGQYLWKSCYGEISLIDVCEIPSLMNGGIGFKSYFGISQFGNKSVERYHVGQFSELIEFI